MDEAAAIFLLLQAGVFSPQTMQIHQPEYQRHQVYIQQGKQSLFEIFTQPNVGVKILAPNLMINATQGNSEHSESTQRSLRAHSETTQRSL